ncbi:hypothetical protein F4820DRAFT_469434 [Hypoxylon rubiginosum]|uniref:Uncharacterized protein n=1 Tax=Hypoxylon rubiginosum TaxID=110542 RepID=A0ACB9Z3K3_9PEZI|nr:hypothetical protein F4820DRAFT_469434 [Hypoxylon rubiginosum]
MDWFQAEAREKLLRQMKSKSSECHVLEIQGSGNNVVASDRIMHMDEVPTYLRSEADQPILKLVKLRVSLWFKYKQRSPELAWVPDIIADLGFDPYTIAMLTNEQYILRASERKTHEERLLNVFVNGGSLRMIVSYNEATSSTTCILFARDGKDPGDLWQRMARFLRENKALFQSPYFLQSSFLATYIMNKGLPLTQGFNTDWYLVNDGNLRKWEELLIDFRLGQRAFRLCRDIACYLREQLDSSKDSDSLHRDVVAGNAGVRNVLNVMEPYITSSVEHVEWGLRRIHDYMATVSRALMRQDTIASMELTRGAKADSSSMKVIAVMTMIFLPGTFFAALFAIPSLKWDNQDVVGEKFWIYWAFTIPFTLLIFFLWLVITQRSQMRSLVDAGKEQWSAQSRLVIRQRTADEEEATKNK